MEITDCGFQGWSFDKRVYGEMNMAKKILIIDDDKELCEEMAEILKGEGYDVSTAFDGLAGKKLIEENHYNLLLLDVKLPDINGLDILKSMR